jgi:aldose 1-epimerase
MPASDDITFFPLGALINTFKVDGLNIVQNFTTPELYVKHNSPFFGETIGRVANRTKNAKIDSLNGKSYTLPNNDGENTLHGGPVGFGKRVWNGPKAVAAKQYPALKLEGAETVEFTLTSEDGDQGFPGELAVKVIYTTGTSKVDGKDATTLVFEYEAELVKGADETAVNLTNHS